MAPPELGQPGDVSVELRFQRFTDSAPPIYTFVEEGVVIQRDEIKTMADAKFFSAPEAHSILTLSFQIKW